MKRRRFLQLFTMAGAAAAITSGAPTVFARGVAGLARSGFLANSGYLTAEQSDRFVDLLIETTALTERQIVHCWPAAAMSDYPGLIAGIMAQTANATSGDP